MKKELLTKLRKLELFYDIDEKELESYFEDIKYEVKVYECNENVAFRGDEIKGLYANLEGILVTEMLKESGEVKKIEELGSYSLIATAFIFGKMNRFPVDLMSKTTTTIFFIEKKELIKLMKKDDRIMEKFLNDISSKAQFLSNHLWNNFANKTIGEKLGKYILENSSNGIFYQKVSVKELAEYFNVSRPSLSRVIKVFLEENILEKIEKGKYKILDMERLREQ